MFFATGTSPNFGFDLETQTRVSLPTNAVRHVRFESDTQIGGGKSCLGLAEVQFFQQVSEIPEPAPSAMGRVGLTLIAARRRR